MKIQTALLTLPIATLISIAACKKKKDETPKPPAPIADFTFRGDGAKAPAAVVFTNASINAETYLWEFGDGDTSSAKNPSHTYNAGGTFSVKLTAKGPGGTHSVTKTLTVLPACLLPTQTVQDGTFLTAQMFVIKLPMQTAIFWLMAAAPVSIIQRPAIFPATGH